MAEGASAAADLRYERDRFVAFAFASADAFLELDSAQVVQYATGAVQWLAGSSPENLRGKPLLDWGDKSDRPLLKAALATAEKQGRFGPLGLRISPEGRKEILVTAFGTHLPVRGGRTFVALSARRMGAGDERSESEIDQATGLLEKGAFGEMAQKAMKAASESGRPYNMTLLDLDGIDELKERLGDEAADELVADISAHMQANSVNGESAGRIEDDKFGIVHDADLDVDALKETIATKTKEADPKGEGLEVGGATVDLQSEMSEADNARALLYTINKFSESHGDFTIAEPVRRLQTDAGRYPRQDRDLQDHHRRGRFRRSVSAHRRFGHRGVHHYEALARLRSMGKDSSPYQFITFAEEVGVIGDFDIAMCQKVIKKIKSARKQGDALSLAYPVNAHDRYM